MTTKHNRERLLRSGARADKVIYRERLLRSGARADKVIFLIAVVATFVIVYWS